MRLVSMMFAAGLSLAAGAPVAAAPPPPQRETNIIVYGDDPCPKAASEDEIVVCAREPESERYRIPKKLRRPKKTDAPAQAWGNRAQTLDDAGRKSAGLPDTCSAVGSGGQTGCQRAFLQRFRDEKRADEAERAAIPGE